MTIISVVLLLFVALGGFFFILLYHGLQQARVHEQEERFEREEMRARAHVVSIISVPSTLPEVVISISDCDANERPRRSENTSQPFTNNVMSEESHNPESVDMGSDVDTPSRQAGDLKSL